MMMPIQELTEEQLNDLIWRYYSGSIIVTLIQEFRLNVSPGKITTLFPPFVLEDQICPYCMIPMLMAPPTRTALNSGRSLPPAYCSNCGHRQRPNCLCIGCEEQRAQRKLADEEANRSLIARLRRTPLHPCVDIDDISLRHAVNLVALSRLGRREDSDEIDALSKHALALRCTNRASETVIRELYELGALDFSLENTPGVISEDGLREKQLDWSEIRFQLRLGSDVEENIAALNRLVERLSNRSGWLDRWKLEILDLWYELAIDELLAYFAMRMVEHHFKPCFGGKTIHMLRNLLNQYSVEEIYNFTMSAVKDAAAYQVRTRAPKWQAGNAAIGYCQRRAERASANGWTIESFKRNPKVPQSECTTVYTDVVTRLGKRFYTVPPSIIHLGPWPSD
jgi:hypothetical protein